MNNPTKDKERSRGELYSRDWYPERYQGYSDGGGVHINSGISNLAFVLLSDGGKHPREKSPISVKAIGINKAIAIFFEAFTTHLVASSNFQDAMEATVKVAEIKFGEEAAKSVKNAWAAVGVI
jgi:vibriolysin